ncbi:alpha-hydroxy acid oxidase [Roseomonas chloroacetimidivorans]|jgi:L-lactate dehydrogenase (cytochrome)|uniref:alpha-hydroxy acid oxidase n=1 Tax=Roseomonas chloroacetimidivorans TaxID=1766656 RepID=UPI003C74EF05
MPAEREVAPTGEQRLPEPAVNDRRRSSKDVPRRFRRILALKDFEVAARRHLPRPIFGYVSGGAEDNQSLDDNRAAFREYGFVPRFLVGVSKRSQETALLGHTYAAPFGIAPMGICALSAYRGDLVLARAAGQANIPMIISGSSLIRLEDIAAAGPTTWFQAYLPPDMPRIEALIDRVMQSSIETLVVTVDTTVGANRENNIRTGFSTPLRPSLRLAWDGLTRPRWLFGTFLQTLLRHGVPHFENSFATRGAPIVARNVEREFGDRAQIDWTWLERIRRRWRGKLVIKGLLHAEDARLARESGADGIIVSNHGGRQLDGAVSPLRVLPRVVQAAGGIPVMLDGGVRRGTDVLKAIGLGASFVFVGRPFNYAAAVGGAAGVAYAINILRSEILRDMGAVGINRLDEMPDRLVRMTEG